LHGHVLLVCPPRSGGDSTQENRMMRTTLFAAAIALAPHFAFAQTVTSDPQLLAVAKQQLMVQQQQLVVLNVIEALEQSHVSPATASAALAYAQQKGQQQARDEQTLQEAQTAAASPQ
jgi:uncharacterized membrane protein